MFLCAMVISLFLLLISFFNSSVHHYSFLFSLHLPFYILLCTCIHLFVLWLSLMYFYFTFILMLTLSIMLSSSSFLFISLSIYFPRSALPRPPLAPTRAIASAINWVRSSGPLSAWRTRGKCDRCITSVPVCWACLWRRGAHGRGGGGCETPDAATLAFCHLWFLQIIAKNCMYSDSSRWLFNFTGHEACCRAPGRTGRVLRLKHESTTGLLNRWRPLPSRSPKIKQWVAFRQRPLTLNRHEAP